LARRPECLLIRSHSIFNLLGSTAITFAYSWKIGLLAIFVILPVGTLAGYYRLKYELEFEKMYAAVFADSSKFAAEAISAFRTVASLTLEDTIGSRYEGLLSRHVTDAYKKAWWTTFIFALSDSIALAFNALVFWLVASRKP